MSQQDLYLVIGILIAGFSIPSMLGALVDRRSPRLAAVLIVIGGALILLALSQQSYAWPDIPEAFIRVLAQVLR